jgi:hypothetical protein
MDHRRLKQKELFPHSFKTIRKELGLDRPRDHRPMWQKRLSSESVFCLALVSNGYLKEAQMQRAAQRYRLGRSRDGGVIFWQIDENDVLRDGKIMYYHNDCHRDHDHKPTWASFLLRKAGQLPEEWHSEHCLFGLHLISPSTKSVAIVEAEKTAVIMSEVKPDCIWLATGGKTELTVAKLKPLQGRRVILFPDTDTDGTTYREWYELAEAAGDVYGQPFTVSSLLEQHATPLQKLRKIDIADFFFEK